MADCNIDVILGVAILVASYGKIIVVIINISEMYLFVHTRNVYLTNAFDYLIR